MQELWVIVHFSDDGNPARFLGIFSSCAAALVRAIDHFGHEPWKSNDVYNFGVQKDDEVYGQVFQVELDKPCHIEL